MEEDDNPCRGVAQMLRIGPVGRPPDAPGICDFVRSPPPPPLLISCVLTIGSMVLLRVLFPPVPSGQSGPIRAGFGGQYVRYASEAAQNMIDRHVG
ncbi:hypothetical protein ColTof4_10247 [Colletotrichum tofieldiae]|nr:hypothetical protein ColTof4_10247 [Colletotrichum tofieldiae]